jgi:hypothetical protein
MASANTAFDLIRGMNDVKRIRMFRFSVLGIAESATGSSGLTSGSSLNTDSKHSGHTPPALTGAVHLLYFVPQALQMAIGSWP